MRQRHVVLSVVFLSLWSAALLAQHPSEPPSPATGTPGRPDLKVKVELQKEQRLGKWYVRMRFTVFSVGLAPAPPSVLGSWCHADVGGPCPALDGHYDVGPAVEAGATGVIRLATPAIPPGGNVFVLGPNTKEWQPGRYTITAKADFPNAIPETIEANNQGSAVIPIP
jgi:hypothetical protein